MNTKGADFLILSVIAASLWAQSSLLPDPSRTPGALNPAVTQQNTHQTICKPGFTKTVRPPVSYTDTLKIRQMAELRLTGRAKDFEEDHFIPLELGGNPTDPHNLWPEPWPDAHKKDVVEDFLHRQVCADKMTLRGAQDEIHLWPQVYAKIKGVLP